MSEAFGGDVRKREASSGERTGAGVQHHTVGTVQAHHATGAAAVQGGHESVAAVTSLAHTAAASGHGAAQTEAGGGLLGALEQVVENGHQTAAHQNSGNGLLGALEQAVEGGHQTTAHQSGGTGLLGALEGAAGAAALGSLAQNVMGGHSQSQSGGLLGELGELAEGALGGHAASQNGGLLGVLEQGIEGGQTQTSGQGGVGQVVEQALLNTGVHEAQSAAKSAKKGNFSKLILVAGIILLVYLLYRFFF